MKGYNVYRAIVKAVKEGEIIMEPKKSNPSIALEKVIREMKNVDRQPILRLSSQNLATYSLHNRGLRLFS